MPVFVNFLRNQFFNINAQYVLPFTVNIVVVIDYIIIILGNEMANQLDELIADAMQQKMAIPPEFHLLHLKKLKKRKRLYVQCIFVEFFLDKS